MEALGRIDRRTNVAPVEPVSRDLAQIRERGSLTVVAPYNSTTYFLYQGEPLGYEYELLQAFAKDLGSGEMFIDSMLFKDFCRIHVATRRADRPAVLRLVPHRL